MKFSERKGYKNHSILVQSESMNNELRISLWNILFSFFWDNKNSTDIFNKNDIETSMRKFTVRLAVNYFKEPIDTLPTQYDIRLSKIKSYFVSCQWYEVYDFLEFTLDFYKDETVYEVNIVSVLNKILERELSGYRLVDGIITNITDPQEIEMLESALEDNEFPAVRDHLHRALELMSDKKNPDYRNSIKESISAVESIAEKLSGKPKATLGDAITILEKNGKVHPALKEAFSKLYGYTSDADGIRHAMQDSPNLDPADARFFLLSCTNFINYLKSKI